MTRVENFAPPPGNSSNAFSALVADPIDFLFKNSVSSGSNLIDSQNSSSTDNPQKRTSSRPNKATTESLKDDQKVFSGKNRPTAVKVTAGPTVQTPAPTAVSVTAASPVPSFSNEMDVSPVEEDNPPPSTAVQVVTLVTAMSLVRDRLSQSDPELAVVIETMFSRMTAEIESLRNSLSFASMTSSVPPAHVPTGTTIKRPRASAAVKPIDVAARNKALLEAWESKPSLNGRKRVCPAPLDDAHLNTEDDQFMVVHLAGFDLQRGEHRATPTAVLTEKFKLAPHTIINVSPMGPSIQELHIVASKLPSLREAVARTEGALKLTLKLDPRMPSNGLSDPDAISHSTARFRERLNRDIARLSQTRSHRLRSLAEFLEQYRDEGLRISAPRPRPRRQQLFASAFLDEAVFDQAASAPTMVADKI